MALIEFDGCIYDEKQFALSHGFESLDLVGREAFVNHCHLDGSNRVVEADYIIQSWIAEMRSRWPAFTFRIYRQLDEDEVIIRFHVVRQGSPNWCEHGVEIVTINSSVAE